MIAIVSEFNYDRAADGVLDVIECHGAFIDELVLIPVRGFDNRFWGLISGLSTKLSLVGSTYPPVESRNLHQG